MSRFKTSGSKRDALDNGKYSDTRHSKRNKNWENLPKQEGMGRTIQFYNGKVNIGLLIRFLRKNVGKNWEQVEQEILSRIPTKLWDYRYIVYDIVRTKVEYKNGQLYDKSEQKYIISPKNTDLGVDQYIRTDFYVEPETNLLKIPEHNS